MIIDKLKIGPLTQSGHFNLVHLKWKGSTVVGTRKSHQNVSLRIDLLLVFGIERSDS